MPEQSRTGKRQSLIRLNTILIAEPDALLIKALSNYLRSKHYLVVSATDELEAWGLYQEYPPDIVLAQIQMPGIDGIELLHRIKWQDPRMPVILMTGHGDSMMVKKAFSLGADEYLYKPFHMDDMLEKIEGMLTRER